MQTESFGARLREQRERQQITLAAIADQTKIKVSLLEGLERDDLSHWPEGIFRRAYVRTYAQAIGLAPDIVLREFLELHPEPIEVAPPESIERQSTRIRYLLGSAVGALSGIRHRHERKPEPVSATIPIAPKADAPEPDVQPEPDVPPELAAHPEPRNLPPDLPAFASLCTRLARVVDQRELTAVLEDAAAIVDAVGMILWIWDPAATALSPVLGHGYSDKALAQMPGVTLDADNAIATAFRSADACVVDGSEEATGAVVVPLMRPRGCVGVLALELRNGSEQREWVRALAAILAAQLATLVASPAAVEAVSA